MNGNVVQIGDFRVTLARRERRGVCQHLRITLDPTGEIVKCDDCGEMISAWYALQTLVGWWGEAAAELSARQARQAEAEAKTVGLRAAQRVERAWRSRTMVPTCPHCHEAIFPEDGFGTSNTNRVIALRRREVAAAEANSTDPSSTIDSYEVSGAR